LTELKAVKYMNPKKKIEKLVTGLENKVQFLESPQCRISPSRSDFPVPLIGFNGLKEDVIDTRNTLKDQKDQLERTEGVGEK